MVDTDSDIPRWLSDDSLSARKSVQAGILFISVTIIGAAVAEWLIGKIPAKFSWAFGQTTLQVQPGISLFFAWDLAAILSMFVYFVVYWQKMFAKDGPLKFGGNDISSVGNAIALLVFGLLFLAVAFVAGLAFSISVPHSMPVQLVFLTLSSYLIWSADRLVMRRHSDRRIQLEFKLFVEFVDLPMAICFTVLTGFYFVYIKDDKIQQFSAFVSGAIAFQIIAFNVAFAFLNRFTEVISRGRTAVLLRNTGEFARDYPDFKNSWWAHWSGGALVGTAAAKAEVVAVPGLEQRSEQPLAQVPEKPIDELQSP